MTRPLAVDLDGTLIKTDLLHEAVIALLRRAPLKALALPVWLSAGKAALKARLADSIAVAADSLPYDRRLLDFLAAERAKGRPLVLATASDHRYARKIADHLGLFDTVIATDGNNLSGAAKAEALVKRFGEKGFDYAGNDRVDFPVWDRAHSVIAVNAGRATLAGARRRYRTLTVFERQDPGPGPMLRALRPHQWAKNLLIFVPLLAARAFDPATLLVALLAFVAFCLVASGTYVINDLFDLTADRRHPTKCRRPIASGALSVAHAVILAVGALGAGLAVGALISWSYLSLLLVYWAGTTLYSSALKARAVVDVLSLAGFYVLRIGAGALATGITVSNWLLIFSMFVFFSLALVKRYEELLRLSKLDRARPDGRGYDRDDMALLRAVGVGSGLISVLVYALYISTPETALLYSRPELLWLGSPVLLFWIFHMWREVHHGRMHADPVVFAFTDRSSIAAGAVMAAIFGFGAWP